MNGGTARNRLAAFDTTTATATGWNPNVNNSVNALLVSGSTVYAGGLFTQRERLDAAGAARGVLGVDRRRDGLEPRPERPDQRARGLGHDGLRGRLLHARSTGTCTRNCAASFSLSTGVGDRLEPELRRPRRRAQRDRLERAGRRQVHDGRRRDASPLPGRGAGDERHRARPGTRDPTARSRRSRRARAGPSRAAPSRASATARSAQAGVAVFATLDRTITPTGATSRRSKASEFTGVVATFTVPDPGATPVSFTAAIDWGDGTPSTTGTITGGNGSFTVTGTHTYTSSGLFNVA